MVAGNESSDIPVPLPGLPSSASCDTRVDRRTDCFKLAPGNNIFVNFDMPLSASVRLTSKVHEPGKEYGEEQDH